MEQEKAIEIARAASRDAGALSAIAQRSKAYWGYDAELLEAWAPDLTLTPRFVTEHPVFKASIGGRTAGLYALVAHGRRVEIEHLWVDPPFIGQGVGRALVEHAKETARTLDGRWLDIVSDPNAETFYRKLGARRVGKVAAPVLGKERFLPRLEIDLEAPSSTRR